MQFLKNKKIKGGSCASDVPAVELTEANVFMYHTINQFIDYRDGPRWQND